MDLKTKRNLPLIALFFAIVAILVLGLGNQPIVAYTIEPDVVSSQSEVAEDGSASDDQSPLSELTTVIDALTGDQDSQTTQTGEIEVTAETAETVEGNLPTFTDSNDVK